MVKRTLELFDCDKCGNEGKRYSVTFEDGTLVMDRCSVHAKKLEALRDEQGEWMVGTQLGRNSFRKTSLTELRQEVEAARRRPRAVRDGNPEDNVRGL